METHWWDCLILLQHPKETCIPAHRAIITAENERLETRLQKLCWLPAISLRMPCGKHPPSTPPSPLGSPGFTGPSVLENVIDDSHELIHLFCRHLPCLHLNLKSRICPSAVLAPADYASPYSLWEDVRFQAWDFFLVPTRPV